MMEKSSTKTIKVSPYAFKVVKKHVKSVEGRHEFTFNVCFKARSVVTPRTIAVSDAFGLGVDEERDYWVYQDFKVRVEEGGIIYIVGPSGSGKSCLLREFKKTFGDRCLTLEDVEFSRDVPLVDTLGNDVNEAIKYLSLFGLNDAFLFLRRYDELSTGQKYRYRLAKLWEQSDLSGKDFLLVDEFCSALDRETAKIIAYNVQKLARKTGKTLFLAACNDDLGEDLAPSVYVSKDLWSEVQVDYGSNRLDGQCSINRGIEIREGTYDDYGVLRHFHYRGRRPVVRRVFKAELNGRVIGVILYCYAGFVSFGRKSVLRIRPFDYKTINENLVRIGRVVVHPRYRSIGLGVRLVQETMPRMDLPFIETIAVMARYNPFFERAGMKRICEKKPDEKLAAFLDFLGGNGFNPEFLGSGSYVERVLRGDHQRTLLVKDRLRNLKNPYLIKKFLLTRRLERDMWCEMVDSLDVEDLTRLINEVHQLSQSKIYLFWASRDPKFKDVREKYLLENYL